MEAKFAGGIAGFRGANFGRDALFGRAEFREYCSFVGAEFGGIAIFKETKFTGKIADFRNAKFIGYANFRRAKFTSGSAYYVEAKCIRGTAEFSGS